MNLREFGFVVLLDNLMLLCDDCKSSPISKSCSDLELFVVDTVSNPNYN